MFCVVLYLIVNMSFFAESNIYHNDCTNVCNIQLNLTKQTYHGVSYEINYVFVVLRNKPFFIKLLNYQAKNINCGFTTSPNYDTTFKVVQEAGLYNSMVQVPPATEDMTAKWKCTIHRRYPVVDLEISFKVRVKGGNEKRIKIKIDGMDISTSLTNSTRLEYDEIAIYSYRHGEMMDLVCSNKRHDGQIYLRYYNSEGNVMIKTGELSKVDTNIIFEYKLYNTHNNYMIDCTYVTAKDRLEFTSRIIFELIIAPSNDDFNIVINNSQLTPYNTTIIHNVKKSQFRFKYFPEETLTVTCELLKDDDLKLHLLDGKDFKPLTKGVEIEEKENNIIKFTISPTLVEQPVICAAYREAEIKLEAKIFFIERKHPKLRILGLNAEDVYTQYTSSSKDWTIHYVFSDGQVLNITCVTSETRNLRLFESSRMQNYSIRGQSISKTFSLEGRHHNSEIICRDGKTEIDYKRQVIIKLYRRLSGLDAGTSPSTSLPSGAPEDYSDVIPVDFNHPEIAPPSDGTGMPDSSFKKKILIGSAVAVSALALTAFTTLCTVFIYRRHKRARLQQSNENLLHQYDAPIPTYPAQWDARPEDNIYIEEHMVHNSMYNSGTNRNENAEHMYVDVNEILKNKNNARTNSLNNTVQYNNHNSSNYSNINAMREEAQDKLYDYVYASVRK